MKNNSLLENQCKILSERISGINADYKCKIGNSPTITALLAKAENRSKEYENGTFIVLVVGPVKSGKSTLVNLIANAYVSPTHFLECTVRPSIISRRHDGEECSISVFTSEDSSNRIEQIDTIIDCIRGIENESSLKNIKKRIFDLTPKNIKEKVELGLKDSLSSETLVTSITTPGGKLMKKDVFIIDMPGFDGEYANIDDPVYDTISQRADLIIFVQSSNSAISKVSGLFLKKLADNNRNVPVCLIHNVFDSSWWRTEDERKTIIAEQKSFAINEIRKQGFNIEEGQCVSINLGMVQDGRKREYSDIEDLRKETLEYNRMEEILYNRVISQRNDMRMNVCLNRTRQQLEKSVEAINKELETRTKLSDRYNEIEREFEKTKVFSFQNIQPLDTDIEILKKLIRDEASRKVSMVQSDNKHRSDSEVKGIVESYITECEKNISDTLCKSITVKQKENELFNECNGNITEICRVCINCGITPKGCDIQSLTIGQLQPVTLIPLIDFRLLIPHKPVFDLLVGRVGGHSASNISGYINATSDRLTGYIDEHNTYIEGYIEKVGGPIQTILEQATACLKELSNEYSNLCNKYWEQCRRDALVTIVADKKSFDSETEQLINLKQELLKILEQI